MAARSDTASVGGQDGAISVTDAASSLIITLAPQTIDTQSASSDYLALALQSGPSAACPGLRDVLTWSINWDASNGYAFANTVAPHLATLP